MILIEEIKVEDKAKYDFSKEIVSKKDYTNSIIDKATLDTYDNTNEIKTRVEVKNIYNDGNNYIIDVKDFGEIVVSRNIMKKMIYDLYLK